MRSIFYDDLRLFVEGEEVRGAQSVSVSTNSNIIPVSCMGAGFFGMEVGGAVESTLSVKQLMVTGQNYFPFSNITGYFSYNDDSQYSALQWSKSRLDSVSFSVSTNSVVEIDTSLTVYNTFSTGSIIPPAQEDIGTNQIARPAFIETNIPFEDTNAVQSITYTLNLNWKPTYFIGQSEPELELIFPINIDVEINTNISDYEFETFSEYCNITKQDLTFIFKTCDGDTIKTITAPDAMLVGITSNGGVGDKLSARLSYKSYVNYTGGLI